LGAAVFVVLGAIQLPATTLILIHTTKYAHSSCAIHVPRCLEPGGASSALRALRGQNFSNGPQRDLRIAVPDKELQTTETTPVKPTSAPTTTDPLEYAS
jgi:hypothetical protein